MWVSVLGLLLVAVISCSEAKDKPVKVSLDAKWNSSPLLLEARYSDVYHMLLLPEVRTL